MQLGEPVAIAPPLAPPPDVALAAELVSVTFKSSVKTSYARTTITGPHWERGHEAEIEDDWSRPAKKMKLPAAPYSKRAAVYLVSGAGSAHDVEVKVRITKSQNITGDARITGNLRGLTIQGTCPTAAGEHVIAATITDPPETIQTYRGRIGWTMTVESAAISLSLGTTLAEIYFILGAPTAPYAPDGVWAEALRFLCGRVGVVGEERGRSAAAKVTAYCHSGHSLRYDTEDGRSHYGVSSRGGAFKLQSYMLRLNPACNCYDQAAAIQALSGAIGVAVRWLYLSPFGYIRPTNLVGVGLCNNPFFGSDETEKLVSSDSPDRTAFGNHAFVGVAPLNILDACAGPHRGDESVTQYLCNSIDETPSLYGRGFRAGKVTDIVPAPGVREVW